MVFSNELIKIWTIKRYLEYCQKHCPNYYSSLCWSHEGAVFHSDVILEVCPYANIQKAVKIYLKIPLSLRLEAGLKEKEYKEMMKIVKKKLKEPVIKV